MACATPEDAMSEDNKIENLKTVKVDVEAVIAEARKNGTLLPDSMTPKPTAPVPVAAPPAPAPFTPVPAPTIVIGRISG
jgi:hypothetical protein